MSQLSPKLRMILRTYQKVCTLLATAVFLLVTINLAIFGFFSVKDRWVGRKDPVSAKYGLEPLRRVYPGMSDNEIVALLNETWRRPYQFEPYTQFKERAIKGYYVNVEKAGFRLTENQGPWPINHAYFNIFLFGGSTTFGYGVPDSETIASHLQAILSHKTDRTVYVYNFGRGHYYSSQERILFSQLLTDGHIPDIAIFIDGLNEFYYYDNTPNFTLELSQFMDGDRGLLLHSLFQSSSIERLTHGMQWRLQELTLRLGKLSTEEQQISGEPREEDFQKIAAQVIDRYLTNRTLIQADATAFHSQPIFVWQPVPTYKYDEQQHLFRAEGYGQHHYSRPGYKLMEKRIQANPLGKDFWWLADIQENLELPLYVDIAHYTGEFSRIIAEKLADRLILENRIPPLVTDR